MRKRFYRPLTISSILPSEIKLTNRNLTPPSSMTDQPSFAELVIYYLPEKEWDSGQQSELMAQGSKTSCLNKYHYALLRQNENCDHKVLAKAWTEWQELGKYENGETTRRAVFEKTKLYGRARMLYQEIEIGLNGIDEERMRFQAKWVAQGLREAKRMKEWNEFQVVDMTFGMVDDNSQITLDPTVLGRKIYR
jgi:hypothetical protein